MPTVDSQLHEESTIDSPELWNNFSSASSEEEYYQSWLELQSNLIPPAIQSILIVTSATDQFKPVASWPKTGGQPELFSDLLERVLDEQSGLLIEFSTPNHFGAAYPVFIDGIVYGVVAFELSATEQETLQETMRQLQWGTAWLELLVRRNQLDADQALLKRLKAAVDLLGVTLREETFPGASMAFTTELAAVCGCERVSLGFAKHQHIKLQAVSHSAEVDQKMNLTRAIERVMEEAVLQRTEVIFPIVEDSLLIYREHEALSRQQAMASIVTFPLYGGGQILWRDNL